MTHECLPTDIVPVTYNLYLKPSFETYKFEGKVTIEFKVNKPTKTIVVNTAELDVDESKTLVNGKIAPVSTSYAEKEEFYTINFAEEITADGTLTMEFVGTLNDQMKGFYRSSYTDIEGNKRYMASTQFEPSDARRCFPCWDEPEHKAVFNISLEVPMELTALANSPEKSVAHKRESKTKVVSYTPTPIMSTYLVAFVIGEFDYLQGYTPSGLPVRVFTPLGKAEQGRFGLEVTCRCIPLYEEFFGIEYPMEKIDLVAIPEFAAGAMENWGLVTYRENALLVDPESQSLKSKTWVALVVCHELAHMWFGNLVTMAWWNGLWLNEAFATWVEYYAVSQLFPEWEIFSQFVELDFGRAQELDGLESTHSVEVECPSFREVDEIFDAISYSKGCALIRMLTDYISLQKLKEGLRIYLHFHKYNNAVTEDLWAAFSKVTGLNVGDLMDNWTKQKGYPVVTVNRVGDNKLKLRQDLFLKTGHKESDSLWKIPLTYVTSANPTTPTRLLFTTKELELTIPEGVSWIKFNYNQTGFYRVNYTDKQMINDLVQAVSKKELSSIDRLGVQSDVCALALAGYSSAEDALNILSGYANENDYIVLKSVVGNLGSFYSIISSDKERAAAFKNFAAGIVINQYKQLGWTATEGEHDLTSLKRALVIAALVKYDEPEVLKTAAANFAQIGKFSADINSAIYTAKIKAGDAKDFDEVLTIFKETNDNNEAVRVISSIGATKDVKKIEFILSEEFIFKTVKSQDGFYPISSLSSNPLAKDLLWTWLSTNFKRMQDHFGSHFLIGRVIKLCVGSFDTKEEKSTVEAFFENKDLPQLKRTIAQAIEGIDLNIIYKERCAASIASFLKE